MDPFFRFQAHHCGVANTLPSAASLALSPSASLTVAPSAASFALGVGLDRDPLTIGASAASLALSPNASLTVAPSAASFALGVGLDRDPLTIGASAASLALSPSASLTVAPSAASFALSVGLDRDPLTIGASAASLALSPSPSLTVAPSAAHYAILGAPQARHLADAAVNLPLASSLESFRFAATDLEAALMSPRKPWFDVNQGVSAVSAFSSLSAVGNALRHVAPFGGLMNAVVRDSLGDWRGVSDPDLDAVLSATARRGFYSANGFDISLVRFPRAAYTEVLRGARLLQDEELDGPSIDLATFSQLRPFEIELRRFIGSRMMGQFGHSWIKQRVSGPTRQRWEERRERAVKDGETALSLLDYADLMDCAEIITRGDNWRELFADIFVDKDEVTVSFRRMNAVRRPLVHGRPIAKEDLLMVAVEVHRLRRALFG